MVIKTLDKGYKWVKKGAKAIGNSEIAKDTKKGFKATGKVLKKVSSNLDRDVRPSKKMRRIL